MLAAMKEVFEHMIVNDAGRHVAVTGSGRPLCRLAVLLQFRSCVEGREDAARVPSGTRAGHAAVVARPVHPEDPALTPLATFDRIGPTSSSGTNFRSSSAPPK